MSYPTESTTHRSARHSVVQRYQKLRTQSTLIPRPPQNIPPIVAQPSSRLIGKPHDLHGYDPISEIGQLFGYNYLSPLLWYF